MLANKKRNISSVSRMKESEQYKFQLLEFTEKIATMDTDQPLQALERKGALIAINEIFGYLKELPDGCPASSEEYCTFLEQFIEFLSTLKLPEDNNAKEPSTEIEKSDARNVALSFDLIRLQIHKEAARQLIESLYMDGEEYQSQMVLIKTILQNKSKTTALI